jgi:hypothetical protein
MKLLKKSSGSFDILLDNVWGRQCVINALARNQPNECC